MKKKFDDEYLNRMSRDPGNWRGPFYFNRKDPRLIVPKLNPMLGWTFNFANRYTWLFLIAAVAIIVLVSL